MNPLARVSVNPMRLKLDCSAVLFRDKLLRKCLQVVCATPFNINSTFQAGHPFQVVPSYSNYTHDSSYNVDATSLPTTDACDGVCTNPFTHYRFVDSYTVDVSHYPCHIEVRNDLIAGYHQPTSQWQSGTGAIWLLQFWRKNIKSFCSRWAECSHIYEPMFSNI